MNVVIRIQTDQRSFILKQSRPYVQKYQQIAAPLDRIDVEHQFYQSIQSEALKNHTPAVLNYDISEYLLMLEDLGAVQDLTDSYRTRNIESQDVNTLVGLLKDIHSSTPPANYPENISLRQLNHQHIFVLPFLEDNGFDLNSIQEGLQRIANKYKSDEVLKNIIGKTGEQYLAPGKTLLHGDYYPGSWMKVNGKVYVLDPEFSFVGFAEFDLGVMAAHLIIASLDDTYVASISNAYGLEHDPALVRRIAGIEIMRRLIGLAQLPLEHSLEEKETLLQLAHRMIRS